MDDKPTSCAEGSVVPRRRDREATTRSLLTAARCVFAEQGYDAATTREIATRADTNEALIQRYFGGKAGLLEAVLREEHAACPALAQASPPLDASLEEIIRSFFRRSCGEKLQREEFMRVAVSRAILDESIASVMRAKICQVDQALILRQLEALQQAGRIRRDADLQGSSLALASLAFSLGFFGRLVYRQPEEELQAAIESAARSFARDLERVS